MDLTRAVWRKASASTNAGNCVEVAVNLPGVVAVRDSKDPARPRTDLHPRRLARVHQPPALARQLTHDI